MTANIIQELWGCPTNYNQPKNIQDYLLSLNPVKWYRRWPFFSLVSFQMWQEFEMVLGQQPQSNHPSSSSSGSNNGGLVSERLNGLQPDNSGTGHLSTATEFNESYYNNYHETSGAVSTTGSGNSNAYELDLSVHSSTTSVKCEPDTTVSSHPIKDHKVPLCPPLRPPPYLDYNFGPSSSSSSDNYNDNNNDLMVQAKLDMYVPPHQYPSQVGVGVSSPSSWGSTQYEHSTYHYTTKHIPPPPPLSYHNGYGTQYPHHPQHSYPTYPPQGGGVSSGPKYSHYASVPSHSFSVNVNVMTPSAAAAAVAATPSSSQLVNLFGHPTTTSSQCVICTTCFYISFD